MSVFVVNEFKSLSYANPDLLLSACIKTNYSDFMVTEELGFDLDGEGEHVCLQIQKKVFQQLRWPDCLPLLAMFRVHILVIAV